MESANLAMLIELARTARDAAATRRAQASMHADQARQQLTLLRGYARDYERRSAATLSQGVDPAAQDNLRAFLGKLVRAVEIQAAELARREGLCAAADAELLQMRTRLGSLEKLAERHAKAALTHAQRREQRSLDEMANRFRRNTGFGADELVTSGW